MYWATCSCEAREPGRARFLRDFCRVLALLSTKVSSVAGRDFSWPEETTSTSMPSPRGAAAASDAA